jgi:N-acetyl-1-D-myo-inositol-2-amino-2-deoxy-alpha-D-glucopyranoside deacetylase
VYSTGIPKSFLAKGLEYFRESGDEFFAGVETVDDLPFGVPDDVITSTVRAPEHLHRKYAAMHAHRSQIDQNGVFFSMPKDIADDAYSQEFYVLRRGETAGEREEHGWETDLFAGTDRGHAE